MIFSRNRMGILGLKIIILWSIILIRIILQRIILAGGKGHVYR